MRLILTEKPFTCVHASLAMLLGGSESHHEYVKNSLPLRYPFPSPYQGVPAGHSMAEVCDFIQRSGTWIVGLMPFDRSPTCSIAPELPEVSVWSEGELKWRQHLRFGRGLLEGHTEVVGHMCAWDGRNVYDPRGYIYAWEDREDYNFDAERFWLEV